MAHNCVPAQGKQHFSQKFRLTISRGYFSMGLMAIIALDLISDILCKIIRWKRFFNMPHCYELSTKIYPTFDKIILNGQNWDINTDPY